MMEGDGGLERRRASDIDNDDRVREWEEGLPSFADLTPLTQCLISPQLASAFSITSDIPPFRSCDDVDRASHSMFAILRNTRSLSIEPSLRHLAQVHTPTDLSPTPGSYHLHAHHSSAVQADDSRLGPPDDDTEALGSAAAPSSDSSEGPTKHVTNTEPEEVESAPGVPDNLIDDATARTLKRPRLVWTPELHKRFIEAVAHLGIKNAVPKTIMQLMNVEGLTRENVASHLQKYRLYLKRMQGLSTEGPTSSDHLFASTPVPPSLAASTRFYPGVPAHLEDIIMQVPYANASVPMPMGRGHVDGGTNAAGTFAPMEPFAFNPYVRPPPPGFVQGFSKDGHGMRENQPDSSSHHILRLFPK